MRFFFYTKLFARKSFMWQGLFTSHMKGIAELLSDLTKSDRSGIRPNFPLLSLEPIDSSVLPCRKTLQPSVFKNGQSTFSTTWLTNKGSFSFAISLFFIVCMMLYRRLSLSLLLLSSLQFANRLKISASAFGTLILSS